MLTIKASQLLSYISNKQTISVADLQRDFSLMFISALMCIDYLKELNYCSQNRDSNGNYQIFHPNKIGTLNCQ